MRWKIKVGVAQSQYLWPNFSLPTTRVVVWNADELWCTLLNKLIVSKVGWGLGK